MSRTLGSGQCAGHKKEKGVNDGFDAALTEGTSAEVIISGRKLNGDIKDANGASYPISGSGDADYVYSYGSDGFHADLGSLASAPQFIPGKVLKYTPKPGAKGTISVELSGNVVDTAAFGNKEGKHHVKLEGRLLSYTATIIEIPPDADCDVTTLTCATSCTGSIWGEAQPDCHEACLEFVADVDGTNGCNV